MRRRRKPARLLWVAAAVLLGIGGVVVPGAGSAGAVLHRKSDGGPQCGRKELTKASGEAWVCTFDEEFNTTSLNRKKWVVQTTANGSFHLGAACMVDSPNTVSVSDGHLNLTVRQVARPFRCAMSSGGFSTTWDGGSVYTNAFAQTYGRFSIRALFPDGLGIPGLQSSLWTYPTKRPNIGGLKEIDIAEAYSRWPDYVMPTVHRAFGANTHNCDMPSFGGKYHTYTLEWSRTAATFYYDGTLCYSTSGVGTSQLFRVILTQGLGIRNNAPTLATVKPATMRVDWVRVWK